MRFRILIASLPLCAALIVAPALAQDVHFVTGTGDYEAPLRDGDAEDNDAVDLAGRMSDPVMHDDIAYSIERATGAIMRVPVGGLASAIEQARPGTVRRDIDRHTTFGELAGPDSAYLPEELGSRSREVMGMMGGFARALAVMMPEFERMGREVDASIDDARRGARRR